MESKNSPFEVVMKPMQAGMSEDKLLQLQEWIAKKTGENPWGCQIIRNSCVVADWYGGGLSAESLFEIGSIRKSFNSALIGIGSKAGLIDLNVKAVDIWPDIIKISGDKADRTITLHHLASSVSGWLTPDPCGKRFVYNNVAFTAAENVVARLFGFPNDEIAPEVDRRFKTPLRAESWYIYHFNKEFTPDDIDNPGPKLAIDSTIGDLVKWGYLWLKRGIWEGKVLIPTDYVDMATRLVNPEIPNSYYGYNWFVNSKRALWPNAPEDSYGHAGWGTFKPSEKESRTYLWICPSLDIVASMVTHISVGFTADFLEIPMAITAEWIGRIVNAVQ